MLKTLINKLFVDKTDDIYLLLQNYDLDTFISSFLIKFDRLQGPELNNVNNVIGPMASTLLIHINSVLEKIKCVEEKEKIEYILSQISTELIYLLLQKEGVSQKKVLTEIKESLIITCEVNDWDTELLLKKTKIDLLHTLSVKDTTSLGYGKGREEGKTYYFKWLKDNYALDELTYNLKDRKTIKSIKEFKKLFSNHSGKIRVRMNSAQINFIIVLFDQLKCNNFIKPCGTRGHFYPLKKYCVDFENIILIKNDPKRIKELIQRKDEEYHELLEQVNSLIGL